MAKPLGLPDDVYATPAHPLADLFPMMPDDDLKALAEDIRKNGQLNDILILDGKVIDGRNRLKACKLAGVRPRFRPLDAEGPPLDYVISLNLHRRHLTTDQKREVVAAVLKADPSRSNRSVADQVKVDHKTVAAVRSRMESNGEVPQLDKTTGRDGRARVKAKRMTVGQQVEPDYEAARAEANGKRAGGEAAADTPAVNQPCRTRGDALALIKECIDILKRPEAGPQTTLAIDHLGKLQKWLKAN